MGKNIQHAGKISHINVYPYDVPFIVTIRVDAIKTAVVQTYARDRAELHETKQLR
jgi:hypothetical protein